MDRILAQALVMVVMSVFLGTFSQTQATETEQSIVSFSSGALLVQKPLEDSESWGAFWILDERPDSGWASAKGITVNNVFVIELAEKTLLKRLEFDASRVDGEGRGAKDIIVEISDEGPSSGFKGIASLSLVDRQDRQSFPVKVDVPGRWVRRATYLGSIVEYEVSVEGLPPLLVQAANSLDGKVCDVGASVGVDFAPGALHVLASQF